MIMTLSKNSSTILTIILLLVQICLPLSGSFYISATMSRSEAGHTKIACSHTEADADHESKDGDGHGQIPHCHELEAPYDTLVSGTAVKHSPLISLLAVLYKGAFLPGYSAPPDIPPEIIV